MTRTLLLLALFTVGTIVGAYVTKNSTLDFLALISGIVFLYQCAYTLRSEREEREEQASRERESHQVMLENARRHDDEG